MADAARRLATVVAVCLGALLVAAPPVLASCAFEPGDVEAVTEFVDRSDGSLFLGEVLYGSGGDARALVAVEEVWRGPDLAAQVLVRTGPAQLPWPAHRLVVRASSVDARLELGTTYLIGVGGSTEFAASECTVAVATDEVRAAAPDDVRAPTSDGSRGHRPGPFDTAAGATLVLALLVAAGLVVWGRRLDGAREAPTGRRVVRGTLRGAVVGVVVAGVAELATLATRQLFPTDVGVVGLAVVVGVPLAAVAGALCWWRDRPASATVRLLLCALPVVLVGAVQVWMQWAAQ